jgi:hypothetical protein
MLQSKFRWVLSSFDPVLNERKFALFFFFFARSSDSIWCFWIVLWGWQWVPWSQRICCEETGHRRVKWVTLLALKSLNEFLDLLWRVDCNAMKRVILCETSHLLQRILRCWNVQNDSLDRLWLATVRSVLKQWSDEFCVTLGGFWIQL